MWHKLNHLLFQQCYKKTAVFWIIFTSILCICVKVFQWLPLFRQRTTKKNINYLFAHHKIQMFAIERQFDAHGFVSIENAWTFTNEMILHNFKLRCNCMCVYKLNVHNYFCSSGAFICQTKKKDIRL